MQVASIDSDSSNKVQKDEAKVHRLGFHTLHTWHIDGDVHKLETCISSGALNHLFTQRYHQDRLDE